MNENSDINAFSFDDIAFDFDNLFDDVGKLTDLEGEAIDRILKPFDVRTVLDCACGTGIQSIGLARKGYSVSASDISPKMVDITLQKGLRECLPIDAKVADFRYLSEWKNGKFDAIISMGNSLTLMPNREDISLALASMIRIVKKPGGIIVIGLHNYLGSKELRMSIIPRHTIADTGKFEVLFDFREFSEEQVTVTYFFINRVDREWRMRTYSKSYLLLSMEELHQALISAGCKCVQLLDISGKRDGQNDDEWVIAVGRV